MLIKAPQAAQRPEAQGAEAMWKAGSVRSEILESMTPAERKRRRYD